jgi:hypothetical protein
MGGEIEADREAIRRQAKRISGGRQTKCIWAGRIVTRMLSGLVILIQACIVM